MREVFSDAEQQILKILGNRKMTLIEITERFYDDGDHSEVFSPNNYIGSAIRRIAKKAEHFDLPWRIAGKRDVTGRTVWKEKK